jgi:hypothetical protein
MTSRHIKHGIIPKFPTLTAMINGTYNSAAESQLEESPRKIITFPQNEQFPISKLSWEPEAPSRITNNLFLGGFTALTQEYITNNNIQKVIIIAKPTEIVDPNFVDFYRISINDNTSEEIMNHFEKTGKMIHEFTSKHKSILVICQMGRSRSATIVLAYLIKYYTKSYLIAYDLVKRYRKINPNIGFIMQLEEWEKTQNCPQYN